MQIFNVSRGGTLIQDIDSQIEGAFKHDQGLPLNRLSHGIEVVAGTRLSAISNWDRQRVNSHHHQSVKLPGRDLTCSALSADSVIEAIEDPRPGRFVIGVQWHPELCWRASQFSSNLFKVFVEECTKFAEKKL